MKKHVSKHAIAAVFALLLMAGAWADTPEVLARYTISPGDMLSIQVFGEQAMSGDYRVGPSGTVILPLIGTVEVGGKRLEDAQTAISDSLRRVLRRPSVSMALNELASERKVYVSGLVASQGPILLPLGATIADAVAGAGIIETGDLRRVNVRSADGTAKTIDISGLITDASLDEVPPVKHGDSIYVPKLTDRLTLLGEIRTPGHLIMPLDEEITLLDAIGQLGGGLTERADRTNALIVREGETTVRVDLKKLLRDGDLSQNIVLHPGDVVVVAEAGKVSVLGEVKSPSSFEVGEPITVLEAIARAGSITADADLAKAQLITPDSVVELDLEGLLERGEMQYNMQVNPGDALLVPRSDPETVLIIGAVARPGVIDIREEEQRDLLRLLTHAGPRADADLQNTAIYRTDGRIVADMEAAMRDGVLDDNIELLPDDIVMVPELNKIYVLGVTRGERAIPLTDGLTLMDVVAATAVWERSNMQEVTLIRTSDEGESEFTRINMSALRRGKVPESVVMREGDIVYIPAAKTRTDWGDVRNSIWTVGALFGLLGL